MEGLDISFFCQALVRLYMLSFFQAQLSAGIANDRVSLLIQHFGKCYFKEGILPGYSFASFSRVLGWQG